MEIVLRVAIVNGSIKTGGFAGKHAISRVLAYTRNKARIPIEGCE
ncbi:hypothetical protein AT5A_06350 [Agrobacterium tumefaciens 5A]|nr:hypothetical protein AT5A_06350 [Agrobacterium tumefaciens 5A]